jgi:hypothetical protein
LCRQIHDILSSLFDRAVAGITWDAVWSLSQERHQRLVDFVSLRLIDLDTVAGLDQLLELLLTDHCDQGALGVVYFPDI